VQNIKNKEIGLLEKDSFAPFFKNPHLFHQSTGKETLSVTRL
jgi:hypothetical protein